VCVRVCVCFYFQPLSPLRPSQTRKKEFSGGKSFVSRAIFLKEEIMRKLRCMALMMAASLCPSCAALPYVRHKVFCSNLGASRARMGAPPWPVKCSLGKMPRLPSKVSAEMQHTTMAEMGDVKEVLADDCITLRLRGGGDTRNRSVS